MTHISPEYIEELLERTVQRILKRLRDEILKEFIKDLREILRNMILIQKETNESIKALAKKLDNTVSQQEELRNSLNELSDAVNKLAEAQRRTEERLDKLAEEVMRLAEAQRRTEERLNKLIDVVQQLSKQVARLSEIIGFGLEDIARVMVPSYLRVHYGIIVEKLESKVIIIDGEEFWLNLFGEGVRNGRKIFVIGECKSQMRRGDVRDFARVVRRLRSHFKEEVFAFMFGYLIHPSAEDEARRENIILLAPYRIYYSR